MAVSVCGLKLCLSNSQIRWIRLIPIQSLTYPARISLFSVYNGRKVALLTMNWQSLKLLCSQLNTAVGSHSVANECSLSYQKNLRKSALSFPQTLYGSHFGGCDFISLTIKGCGSAC